MGANDDARLGKSDDKGTVEVGAGLAATEVAMAMVGAASTTTAVVEVAVVLSTATAVTLVAGGASARCGRCRVRI
jgi:hypothetical protein